MFLSLVFVVGFSTNTTRAEGQTNHQVETTFELICSFFNGLLIGKEGDMTVSAIVPKSVKPGSEFNIDVSLTVKRPHGNELFGTVPGGNFRLTEPLIIVSSENVSRVYTAKLEDIILELPEGEPYTYSIPLDGTVTIGPIIAGEEGNVVLKLNEVSFKPTGTPKGEEPPAGVLSQNCQPEEVIATIPIDGEAPVITLNGDNPMIVKQGDPYVEPGATAQDNVDGDISNAIEISGNVDTNTIGTYTVTYTVSDNAGNVATVERTVNVVEPFGSWFVGEGPPKNSMGVNGDFYLDITSGDVYKRTPTAWVKVGNIKGKDGKLGSKIHHGTGEPKADLGEIGDLYLNTKTGDLYEKTANGWKKIANLQGPAGKQGPSGTSGDGNGKGTKKSATNADGTGKVGVDSDGKSKSKDSKGSSKGGKLPKTATDLPMYIAIGVLLIMIGSVIFLRHRRSIG